MLISKQVAAALALMVPCSVGGSLCRDSVEEGILQADLLGSHSIQCDPNAKYRSIDGTCNNLDFPDLGAGSNSTGSILDAGIFIRLEEAEYKTLGDVNDLVSPREDGPNTPVIVGVDGVKLPSGTTKSPTPTNPKDVNTLFVYLTQFFTHDFAETVVQPFDPFGFNPTTEPFDSQGRPFTLGILSESVLDEEDVPQQRNGATSYMDLSQIYGAKNNIANALRKFEDGLMKMTEVEIYSREYNNFPNQNLCNCTNTTSGEPILNFLPDRSNANEILTLQGFPPWVTEPAFFEDPINPKCYSPSSFNPFDDEPLGVYTCKLTPGGIINILLPDVECVVDFAVLTDPKRTPSSWNISALEYPPVLPEVNYTVPQDTTNSGSRDGTEAYAYGDVRNSENMAQNALSIMFLREHNDRARKLKVMNPGWDDEKLYQEARKWNIAVAQQMWYNEVLPVLVGETAWECAGFGDSYYGDDDSDDSNERHLDSSSSSSSSEENEGKYNPNIDPRISNSFVAAGFRLHSMVPKVLFYVDPDEMETGVLINSTKEILFNGFFGLDNPGPAADPALYSPLGGQTTVFATVPGLYAWLMEQMPEGVNEPNEALMAGLINQYAPALDHICEKSIADIDVTACTQRVFVSIPTLTIFRGRVQGVPNYHDLREFYTGDTIYGKENCPEPADDTSADPIECFEYLCETEELAVKVKDMFGRLDLIDPWYGLMLEQATFRDSDALLSKTAAEMMIDQMIRLKEGDRFWYESNIHEWTEDEEEELEETTLAALIQRHFPALDGQVTDENVLFGKFDYAA